MSVLIKGMQMPKSCCKCEYSYCEPISGLSRCNITNLFIHDNNDKFPESCPLVELPKHHGRLIDADALKTWFGEKDLYSYDYIIGIINDEATVIEAERIKEVK